MKVLYQNKLYDLEIPFMLFESLKRTAPNSIVELMESNQSTYKERIEVPVKDVEDWSVHRNLQALNK